MKPISKTEAHYLAPIRRQATRYALLPGLVFLAGAVFFFYASFLMNGLLLALITPPAWICLGISLLCLYSAFKDFTYRLGPDFGVPLGPYDVDACERVAAQAAAKAPAYSGKGLELTLGPRFPPSVVVTYTRDLGQLIDRQRVQVSAGVNRDGRLVSLVYHFEDIPLLDRGTVSADRNEAADQIVEALNSGQISQADAMAAWAELDQKF